MNVTITREFLKWKGDRSFVGIRTIWSFWLYDEHHHGLAVYLDGITVEERASARHRWRFDRNLYCRLRSRGTEFGNDEAAALATVPPEVTAEALKVFRDSVALKEWAKR